MNNENKNRKKKYIVLILLAIIMTGSYFICGTYAKYASAASGTGSAKAAKWSFKVGDVEIATSTPQTLDFNLFDTVNEADTTTTEVDVESGKIAPGTGGMVSIDVTNTSEVTALYSISLEQKSNSLNIPIEYSLDKTSWSTSLENIKVENQKLAIGDSKEGAITVYWRWPYEVDASADTFDTSLGIAAQTTDVEVVIGVSVSATQFN